MLKSKRLYRPHRRTVRGAITRRKIRENWLLLFIFGFVSLGALGSGLSYLESSARERARRSSLAGTETSVLDPINPFLSPPPTPQLAREYIYAGSRLLAVDDANSLDASPSDLAVWRPSTGTWWVMGGGEGSQQATQQWGTNGDVPVPGDFDGDGRTDFSIFRPASNQWWVLRSGDGTFSTLTFGAAGDLAAPADFDGDGRTDHAVFRASSGTWFCVLSSSGQSVQFQFGTSGDVPDPRDFDGDGKADLAVWRASNRTFYTRNTSNSSFGAVQFASGGAPVSGDYDGDGRADPAIRNGSEWVIRDSASGSVRTVAWQTASDVAVPNDYDGDGRTDIAVWRPANGNWYIRKSTTGSLRQEAWGIAGDIPVPSFFRR